MFFSDNKLDLILFFIYSFDKMRIIIIYYKTIHKTIFLIKCLMIFSQKKVK